MRTDPLYPIAVFLPLADAVTARTMAATTWTTNGPTGEPVSDDACHHACTDDERGLW
jgi:hypothetical protein